MATHSSVLAWRIPGTEEPGRLLSMGSHRVGHDWSNLAAAAAAAAMAPHSNTLAWKIPCTEDPGRLQSMGSLKVGHGWAILFSLFTFMHWRRKWQPTPVFLPGESRGWGSLVEVYGVWHASVVSDSVWLRSSSSDRWNLVSILHP